LKILIKNGRVIDPANEIDGRFDVLIDGGKIAKVAKKQRANGAKTIDASGCIVMPGLVDMHVHLRDPGNPLEETIASGSRAAALGGFTSIACMANTEPPVDNPSAVKYVVSKARAEAVVNVFPLGSVTKGMLGKEITEMGRMLDEGAVGFSDDGHPLTDGGTMRVALEYASQFKKPIIVHAEALALVGEGKMAEGALATKMGLPGIPDVAEAAMVERDLMLAEEYGWVHFCHISTAKSVELIRQAKKKKGISHKRKVRVTAETAPHYFSLTEEAVEGYNTNAKVSPPLRPEADRKAVLAGLRDGTLDCIATDHAPHLMEEKEVEFGAAANGMIGLETALSLSLDAFGSNLPKMVEKLAVNPAKILGIKKGTLSVGADGDVIVVDPNKKWTVLPETLASKSKNSPWLGQELTGKTLYTVVGGNLVVNNGKLSR
jgi:dihydroorotase